MKSVYSLDDLVTDDSFIRYCLEPTVENTANWQQYLVQYPKESKTLIEAYRIVLLLHDMMDNKYHEIEEINENETSSTGVTRFLIFYKVAAVLIITGSLLFIGVRYYNPKSGQAGLSVANSIFRSTSKEKKIIVLPDSTVVTLNVSSELELDKGYGTENRNVRLNGEAFFDVSHNERRPFILKAKEFSVKVIGTRFDVKAYSGNEADEATLIDGSIELSLSNEKKKYLLQPNEKAVINCPGLLAKNDSGIAVDNVQIHKVAEDQDEVAWLENKFVTSNRKFSTIKHWLERLYEVNIFFTDEEVREYRFTGTFDKQHFSIKDVLMTLKRSNPFEYKIDGKNIYIGRLKG